MFGVLASGNWHGGCDVITFSFCVSFFSCVVVGVGLVACRFVFQIFIWHFCYLLIGWLDYINVSAHKRNRIYRDHDWWQWMPLMLPYTHRAQTPSDRVCEWVQIDFVCMQLTAFRSTVGRKQKSICWRSSARHTQPHRHTALDWSHTLELFNTIYSDTKNHKNKNENRNNKNKSFE